MGKVSIADSIRALESRRACIAGIEADLWREWEAGAERDNSSYVPSTQNRINNATLVQIWMALSDGQLIIYARHPTLAIVEICQSFFSLDVEAVLRPRRVTANFRLVVDSFAVSERAQEIESMAGPLFRLELKCMVSRTPTILYRRERSKLRIGLQRRIEIKLRGGNLIGVAKHLQVSSP
jgi:hypothetical protein